MAAEAVQRWSQGGDTRRDDITCIVLMFASLSRDEAEAQQLALQQEAADSVAPHDVSVIISYVCRPFTVAPLATLASLAAAR